MSGTNMLGGGIPGTRLKGEERARWLAHARSWRERMKPVFDQMDADGLFADSPMRRGPYARRIGNG